MNSVSPDLKCQGSIPMWILPNTRPKFDNCTENGGAFGCQDVLFNVFWQCVAGGDKATLVNLSCLSKYHYTMFTKFAEQKIPLTDFFGKLFKRCNNNLTVWDPEAFQHTCALPILLCNFDGFCHVENQAGATAFYYEERTMDELIDWSEQLGVELDIEKEVLVLEKDRELPKENPQICIVTNGIFEESRGKEYKELKDLVENKRGSSRLTARKAVHFAVRTIEVSKGKSVVFGENPPTCTHTSTLYNDLSHEFGDEDSRWYLAVGECATNRLWVTGKFLRHQFMGAAGQWKFPVNLPTFPH